MGNDDKRFDDMVPVYEVGSRPHADIVAGALQANGIPAHVFMGNFEGSAYGGIGSARVMVRAEDVARARRIIAEAEGEAEQRE